MSLTVVIPLLICCTWFLFNCFITVGIEKTLMAPIDGSVVLKESLKGSSEDAQQLGNQLANKLLDMGAREILAEVYDQEQE